MISRRYLLRNAIYWPLFGQFSISSTTTRLRSSTVEFLQKNAEPEINFYSLKSIVGILLNFTYLVPVTSYLLSKNSYSAFSVTLILFCKKSPKNVPPN